MGSSYYLPDNFVVVFLCSCNHDVKDCKIISPFYKKLLPWWAVFGTAFSTKRSVSHSIIWNNKDIRIDNKAIYYSNYIEVGILLINHLQFNNT